MDEVFRALSDPSRRLLLDRLFLKDGQTLTRLTRDMDMTRFGVMKHLRILEEAGLVVTRRSGREKLHYLNPVPIRQVYDRWTSKYAEPWASTLVRLKRELEEHDMTKARHVFQIFIKAAPERIWRAITHPEDTRHYYYGTLLQAVAIEAGEHYAYVYPDGTLAAEGQIIEAVPPRRLTMTFAPRWNEAVAREGPSRMTWEIEPIGEVCKVTVIEDDLLPGSATEEALTQGTMMILSGLKTLIETGRPLVVVQAQ